MDIYNVRERTLVAFLAWTSILKWWMTRFVFKMDTKETCVTSKLNYVVKNILLSMGSIVNTMGGCMWWSLEEKEKLTFNFQSFASMKLFMRNLKWQFLWLGVASLTELNETTSVVIQESKLSMKLEVPPHTLLGLVTPAMCGTIQRHLQL